MHGEQNAVTETERTLHIAIRYCTPCQFLGRATWVAQELLGTFQDYTVSLSLEPGRGGVFDVEVNGNVVFSKHEAGRYPELRELKEAVARYLDEGAWAPKHTPHTPSEAEPR
jgi:selenoprotein W-related protein